MSLFGQVIERLDALKIPSALIGAEALALRGFLRSTADRDVLVTDRRVLDPALWSPFEARGLRPEVRRGDPDDPLLGVVKFEAEGERSVDLLVGRAAWQARIVERSERVQLEDVEVGLPRTPDLILLKLYAGGSQDAWDVTQLLTDENRSRWISEVEDELDELPVDARQLWTRILES